MQTSCLSADLCSNGFAWLASWIIAVTPVHFWLLGIPPGLILKMTGGDLLGEHVPLGSFFGGNAGSDVCSTCRRFRVMTSETSKSAHGMTWTIDRGKRNKRGRLIQPICPKAFGKLIFFLKAPDNIHL